MSCRMCASDGGRQNKLYGPFGIEKSYRDNTHPKLVFVFLIIGL